MEVEQHNRRYSKKNSAQPFHSHSLDLGIDGSDILLLKFGQKVFPLQGTRNYQGATEKTVIARRCIRRLIQYRGVNVGLANCHEVETERRDQIEEKVWAKSKEENMKRLQAGDL